MANLCEIEAAASSTVVQGENSFAFDLYGKLKGAQGNLFFSPYSISACLAMTYAGAHGDTEKQMAQALHFGGNQAQVQKEFGALQLDLSQAASRQAVALNMANALWARQGHPFLPAFLGTARNDYQANISQADFQAEAPSVLRTINDWVAQKTQDKIKNLLPPGSINGQTHLVLANAIYFKGGWATEFRQAQTSQQPFHTDARAQVNVPLMYRTGTIRYMDNDTFQAVELPYKGNRISMVIFLPRVVDGCAQMEAGLTADAVSQALSQFKPLEVELLVPKFEASSTFELNDPLKSMGMVDAFGPSADFSGMDGTRNLYISLVMHEAWVKVNEEGTEAAAATTVTVQARSVRRPINPPIVFRADHPFVFLIRDTQSGAILFLGRLSKPAA